MPVLTKYVGNANDEQKSELEVHIQSYTISLGTWELAITWLLLTGLLLEFLYKQNNQSFAGRMSDIIVQVIANFLLDGLAIGIVVYTKGLAKYYVCISKQLLMLWLDSSESPVKDLSRQLK